jgi:hypothetical protein
LTALENSACGVTIALSNKYNASKVFQANQSIYLFDPKNPIDLAKAIKKTYRDKDLKLKQKKVVQNYNWIETIQNQKLTQEFVQKPLKIQSKLQSKLPQIYFDGNQKKQVTKINNLVKAYFYWEFRDKLWANQNTWRKYQNWLKEAKKLKIRDRFFLQNPKLGESELGFYEDSELLKCLNLQKPITINKKESRLILFLDKDNTAIKKTDGKSNHPASLKLAQITEQKHIPIWVISGDSFEAVEADFGENPIKLAAASCNVGVSKNPSKTGNIYTRSKILIKAFYFPKLPRCLINLRFIDLGTKTLTTKNLLSNRLNTWPICCLIYRTQNWHQSPKL